MKLRGLRLRWPRGGSNRRNRVSSRRDGRGKRRGGRPWSAKRIAICAAAVVLLAGIAYALPTASKWGRDTGSFTLVRVDVTGNVVLTPREVIALSEAEMGTNLVSLDTRRMESLLTSHPRVARASATVSLPDRLTIRIEETLPVLLIATGEGCVEAAADGLILPAAERSAAVDLPVLTGAACSPEPGERLDSEQLRSAVELLERTRRVSHHLWKEISEIRIAPESGLLLYTVADGAEIRFGSGALDDDDLCRLWAVLSNLRERGDSVESIDLRFSDQAVVRIDRAARRTRV